MPHVLWSWQPRPLRARRRAQGVGEGHVVFARVQLLEGFGIAFDELYERQVVSLDEFVYVLYRGHLLEITSIVAPLPNNTLQESYAIHPSA
jgi:hypothetical protein